MNQNEFLATISQVRPSATFLSLFGYRNERGEVSDQNLVFHVSYRNLLERSLAHLDSLSLSNAIDIQAQGELRQSFLASLAKIEETPIEEIEDAYERFTDETGAHIKGIKRHRESGAIHLTAVVQAKRIITPGDYPEVKSKPLTLAKNALKAQLPIAKWRQFKLTPDKVDRISVDSLKLLPPV